MAVKWSYQWARKFSVSRFEVLYHVVQSNFFKKEFGVQINHFLVIPQHGNEALYAIEDEYSAFAKKVNEKLISDEATYQYYKSLIKENQRTFVNTTKKIVEQPLSTLPLKELQSLYLNFFRTNNQFFNTAIWIPFCSEPYISAAAKDVFESLLKQQQLSKEYQVHFDAIFLPEEKNAITCERQALLEIVENSDDGKYSADEIQTQLKKHAAAYCWIPCYDINDSPWDIDDFVRLFTEAQGSDWKKELQELRSWEKRSAQFNTTIQLLQPNSEQELLLRIAHDMVFIKDERDDYRRQGSYTIQPLFTEIGRRMGDWSLDEVTALLSTELLEFFSTGKIPHRSTIQERLQGYVMLFQPSDSSPTVTSGKQALTMIQQELQNTTQTHQQEVRGISGSRGTAVGPAIIVHTKNDLSSVKNGDVLIAVTTHPDFVPAMRRAAAIVTDEGGLTCHAAIVSRELGIPCVVGTKNATATFAHNEQVEVQGDTGIVKHVV